MELKGKYETAKVMTDMVDQETISQIINICNQESFQGSDIRIMPDCHAGKGAVIGFTAKLGEQVVPNIIGVDISCGMFVVDLGKEIGSFELLDQVIRKHIPSGMTARNKEAANTDFMDDLKCFKDLVSIDRLRKSQGTLGGGNHFVEIDTDDDKNYYLVIHTGSRNLGKQVAKIYQDKAIEQRKIKDLRIEDRNDIIKKLTEENRQAEIAEALQQLSKEKKENYIPPDLAYLEGYARDCYIHDMKICQEYATLNRKTIAKDILKHWLSKELSDFDSFEVIHNYIDFKANVIRKGAISAQAGERVLIPLNMRDGCILGVGKGNPEWNYSAPHGAGRIMSRGQAKGKITLEEFQESMKGIYTTSVLTSTIDESPMAYKPMDLILECIEPVVEDVKVIKPVYNFKASE